MNEWGGWINYEWLFFWLGILSWVFVVPAYIWEGRVRDRKFNEAVKRGDVTAGGGEPGIRTAPTGFVVLGACFLILFLKIFFSH